MPKFFVHCRDSFLLYHTQFIPLLQVLIPATMLLVSSFSVVFLLEWRTLFLSWPSSSPPGLYSFQAISLFCPHWLLIMPFFSIYINTYCHNFALVEVLIGNSFQVDTHALVFLTSFSTRKDIFFCISLEPGLDLICQMMILNSVILWKSDPGS